MIAWATRLPMKILARCVDEDHHKQQFGNQRAARGTYQQAQPSAFQVSEPQSESHEGKEVPKGNSPHHAEIKPGESGREFRRRLSELQFVEEDADGLADQCEDQCEYGNSQEHLADEHQDDNRHRCQDQVG